MRVNRGIKSEKVRVISEEGQQIGIMSSREALRIAEQKGLDLVEIAPKANPPVCKIIDYGKYKYQITKKEKESKKAQHQIKVKEVKLKPNIDEHDFLTKLRRAKEFLQKGNKVKITCMFRGRQMLHIDLGEKLIQRMMDELEEYASAEAKPKLMGRIMTVVLAPQVKKVKPKGEKRAEDENAKSGEEKI